MAPVIYGGSSKGPAPNMGAWLYGKNDLRILPFPLPEKLGPHEVRVQIRAVGICGSDVHYLKTMHCGSFHVEHPMVIGHESAGTVIETGSEVDSCHLAVGDHVALEPGVSCGECQLCKTGRYNLCSKMKFFSTPPVHGSLANQEGALCEPLSVAVHACRRAGSLVGCHVAVMGAGPIGLVTMMMAQVFGASKVAITDVRPQRLRFAKEMGKGGGVETVMMSYNDEDESAEIDALKAALDGRVDVTFDCVGVTKSLRTAMQATTSGGKVVLIGAGHSEMKVPSTAAAQREIEVVGSFLYVNTYPFCLELLASKKIDVRPLITHRFGFTQTEIEVAFETSAKGEDAVKVMFNL